MVGEIGADHQVCLVGPTLAGQAVILKSGNKFFNLGWSYSNSGSGVHLFAT